MVSRISVCFSFSGEMVNGHGEDSYLYSVNENKALVGVFDGCGGIGSRRYEAFSSNTGAYVASRVVGGCVAKWFDAYSDKGYAQDKTAELCAVIGDELEQCKNSTETGRIRGSMTRDFPTTLAMVIAEPVSEKQLVADFIWAGDSRGYYLGKKGLVQVTKDDIDESVDALDNISSDGVLTNVVSAERDFVLHSKTVPVKDKCIIFCATDGCFGYIKTPMEFEYLILFHLMSAESVNEWKESLESAIRGFAGDDHTLSLMAFGFNTFGEMKEYYKKRTNSLYENYITRLENATQEETAKLWETYKKVYYGRAL